MDSISLKSFLQEHTIFASLSEEEINRVIEIMVIREFNRNETIFIQGDYGDSFYLVLTGEVKIYKISPDGREKTLAFIGEGNFFGEMALIDQKSRSASAETLVKTRLGIIYRDHFNTLIVRYPVIALKIIAQLVDRLRRANQQIESLVFKDVRQRLIQFLLQYAEVNNEDGWPVSLLKKVTHQEIANLIGTSRETVTRLLGELQSEELILIKGRMIYIKNLKSLETQLVKDG